MTYREVEGLMRWDGMIMFGHGYEGWTCIPYVSFAYSGVKVSDCLGVLQVMA
jgi:hypothetical protein